MLDRCDQDVGPLSKPDRSDASLGEKVGKISKPEFCLVELGIRLRGCVNHSGLQLASQNCPVLCRPLFSEHFDEKAAGFFFRHETRRKYKGPRLRPLQKDKDYRKTKIQKSQQKSRLAHAEWRS